MAFDIGSITAKIDADVTGFKNGIAKAKDEAGGFATGLGGVMKVAGGVGVAVAAAAAVAGAAIIKLTGVAGEAQTDMIRAETLLQNSFGDNAKALTKYRQAMDDTAKSMIKLGFDDEETSQAFAKSLVTTKDVVQTQKDLALAADFARLKQIDLGTSQALLQKAYMGSSRELKAYGIELDDNASKAQIFAAIQGVAGGQAESFSNTYAGAVARFNIEFGNLQENLGTVFLPLLTKGASKLADFVAQINETDLSAFMVTVETIAGVLWQVITDVVNAVSWLQNTWTTVTASLTNDTSGTVSTVTMLVNTYLLPTLLAFQTWLKEVFMPAVNSVWSQLKLQFNLFSIWFMANWDLIKGYLEGTWQVIKGVIQVAWAIISGIITVGLQILAGNWSGAWNTILQKTRDISEGVGNILGGMIGMIKNWGGLVVREMTKPFYDAWHQIEDLVNKIKNALDFTQRHSPSVVDIVKTGVGKVNDALGGLSWGASVNANMAGSAVSYGGAQNSTVVVQIDMAGALIADTYGANYMAELMGDGIIKRLQSSIRI